MHTIFGIGGILFKLSLFKRDVHDVGVGLRLIKLGEKEHVGEQKCVAVAFLLFLLLPEYQRTFFN